MKFLLYNNEYWELCAPPIINSFIKIKNKDEKIIYYKIKNSDYIIDSNWNEILYNFYQKNQDSKFGWIDKNGIFFGCKEHDHARCIQIISNMREEDAEKVGWIKIYYDKKLSSRADGLVWYINKKYKPTKQQFDTLLFKGFNI